jgi:DNA-binding response OmpR family regulator
MVTAEGDQKQIVKALTNGATDYIVKPISQETLEKKMRAVIEKLGGKAS